ncbi:VTT domain-containing protein [Kordiimonas sp. SCSIO 12603]|uniref:DedA family protein n=1 Tax=Kordiimonas sp. SCSIO 12603 TaxID=2829596 RepID=UPI00210260C5|nr:VTT domain-containing protein [Kordiimonas sp. SCSIO 12603]UTW59642.1 VTT domain-containing protein [Kordiimonas sp. SCSIO 12603]
MDLSPENIIQLLESLAHDPLLLGLALALATFATEDGTLIAGSILVGMGVVSPLFAITAIATGILVGDIGLYGLGWTARDNNYLRKKLPIGKTRKLRRWLKGKESGVLFFSRFTPGTRLVTYLTFGFLKLSFTRFVIVMGAAAIVWVTAMVLFVSEIQQAFSEYGSIASISAAVIVALAMIILIPRFIKTSGLSTQLPDPAEEKEDLPLPPNFETSRGSN